MFFTTTTQQENFTISLAGDWNAKNLPLIKKGLDDLSLAHVKIVTVDAEKLTVLDTAGAWLLKQFIDSLHTQKKIVEILHLQKKQQEIYDLVAKTKIEELLEKPRGSSLINLLMRLGEGGVNAYHQTLLFISFVGEIAVTLCKVVMKPKKLRFTSIVRHMDEAGLNAIPIVALIAFLTSVVLAYQGAVQLRQFGADIYTVDLVAISILREMGVLLTAIMVAGRSGSAFAAEIGVMQVNEEVDAMRTMGLNPDEILVIPRVIALVLMMPILTFIADMMGLFGGALMSIFLLDISFQQFVVRVHHAVGLWTFGVGLIKAPFFGFIIATIGCLKGMQVTGSAEKVGEMTTSAVVQAIFIVIFADAIFSIIFSKIGI